MTLTDDAQQGPIGPAAPSGTPPRRRKRAPSAAPAARFEPGRVAEARHRNPTWIVAGVLLVLLSALSGVLLFTSSDDRTEVLVAAADLEPGQPIERSDLRVQRIAADAGVASMPATSADDVIGEHPVGFVPAGTLLSPAMFEAAIPLGADEIVVGAALDPGEAPLSQLAVGDVVELVRVVLPPAGVEGEATAESIGAGTIWAVESVATGQLWVSVRVQRDVGMEASLAAAEDRLRLALVGGDG